MKRDENETLCWNNEMRMNDMKHEALHLIMIMIKKLYNSNIYLHKKINK